MRIHIIFLAAGYARRFGENKLLADAGGKPLYLLTLEPLAELCRSEKNCRLLVVTSCEEIACFCGKHHISCIKNCGADNTGIASTIKKAILYLKKEEPKTQRTEREADMFFNADQPFLDFTEIRQFLRRYACQPKKIGTPVVNGEWRNPNIFDVSYREQFLTLPADKGGKYIMKQHRDDIFFFETKNERQFFDIDTKEAYRQFLEWKKQSGLSGTEKTGKERYPMRMYDLILKKKHGEELTKEEIDFMVKGFTDGSIPDYQMSSMLMAICFQGMTKQETVNLTLAMRDSGDVMDLSGIEGIKVDKHSTGGVGDKTSLALTPIIASLGVPVAKMSGRGLGHTGGTIDKLECFPGFTTAISEETFIKNVNEIKIAIAGQTANLAPADKKLYALRDVTATVDQMSLIASSIMSKKLASGSDAIVLDVKTGNGAFMKKMEQSAALAEEMVSIGNMAGKKTAAVITDMDQPLGYAVGNSLEVKEAIDTLNGHGPKDFEEVVFALGAMMLILAKKAGTKEDAEKMMRGVIANKKALDKLAEFVRAQGGDDAYVYDTSLFPEAAMELPVISEKNGYVHRILAEKIGLACMTLGGGRETKESVIDLSVGIVLKKKNGDKVEKGETLAVIYANDKDKAAAAQEMILASYDIGETEIKTAPVIRKIIL